MRHVAIGLAAALIAAPASAQVTYWLPNGPGGTTYNNPQGSMSGSYYQRELERHADRHRWERQRQQQGQAAGQQHAGPAAGAIGRDPSFRLVNVGGRVVREVYVSASQDSNWGGDRLGRDVLSPGERLMVRLPPGQCLNDIRIVFTDGRTQERRRIDTCSIVEMPVQ